MAQVPARAVRAVIGVQSAVAAMASPRGADCFATADEHRLRRAAALELWQVSVDELSVCEEAHEPILDGDRDTYRVAIRQSLSESACSE